MEKSRKIAMGGGGVCSAIVFIFAWREFLNTVCQKMSKKYYSSHFHYIFMTM